MNSQFRYQMMYCLSKKSCPNLYSNLLYKMGQDFLDTFNFLCKCEGKSVLRTVVLEFQSESSFKEKHDLDPVVE